MSTAAIQLPPSSARAAAPAAAAAAKNKPKRKRAAGASTTGAAKKNKKQQASSKAGAKSKGAPKQKKTKQTAAAKAAKQTATAGGLKAPQTAARKGSKAHRRKMHYLKRPESPYFVFQRQVRPTLRAQHPNASFGELSKLVSQEWAKTTPEQRKPFVDTYEAAVRKRTTLVKLFPKPPKASPNSYFLFADEHRDEIKAQFPDLPLGKLQQKLGARWSQLPPEKRKPYEDKASRLRAERKAASQDFFQNRYPEYNTASREEIMRRAVEIGDVPADAMTSL